jgi:hypothetical protein
LPASNACSSFAAGQGEARGDEARLHEGSVVVGDGPGRPPKRRAGRLPDRHGLRRRWAGLRCRGDPRNLPGQGAFGRQVDPDSRGRVGRRRSRSLAKSIRARTCLGVLARPADTRGAAEPQVPQAIGPGETVGLRSPDHEVALELLRSAGPLATSSGNRSGEASATNPAAVQGSLGGRIAVILDGGESPGGRPSTVIDCIGPEPILLRQGPISFERVLAVWARSH